MRLDYSEIIIGILFLFLSVVNYLSQPYTSIVPMICTFSIYIVTGVFELKKYYNKYVYIAVIAVILVVMWLFKFIQPQFADEDIFIYNSIAGLSTLLILGLVVLTLQRWIKNENTLKEYDGALRLNPDDITALNNKGVVLTIQREYDDAMECFDKVLEIAPGDGVTLQNKNMLEMKLQNKTFSKQVSDKPELEIIEKEGLSILEIKKK